MRWFRDESGRDIAAELPGWPEGAGVHAPLGRHGPHEQDGLGHRQGGHGGRRDGDQRGEQRQPGRETSATAPGRPIRRTRSRTSRSWSRRPRRSRARSRTSWIRTAAASVPHRPGHRPAAGGAGHRRRRRTGAPGGAVGGAARRAGLSGEARVRQRRPHVGFRVRRRLAGPAALGGVAGDPATTQLDPACRRIGCPSEAAVKKLEPNHDRRRRTTNGRRCGRTTAGRSAAGVPRAGEDLPDEAEGSSRSGSTRRTE